MDILTCAFHELPIFTACGLAVPKDGFVHSRRIGQDFELIVGVSGKTYIEEDGVRYEIEEGSTLLLYPGKEHVGYQPSLSNSSFYWLHFMPNNPYIIGQEQLQEGENILQIPKYYKVDKYANLFIVLRLLANDYVRPNKSALTGKSFLLAALAELSEIYKFGENNNLSNAQIRFKNMEFWIYDNLHRPISTSALAEQFQMNKNYLSSLFKKKTGRTPTQYINEKRIERAKSLLAHEMTSIKEAAYSCGFTDERYFSRVFKQSEGITPSAFQTAYYEKHINRD